MRIGFIINQRLDMNKLILLIFMLAAFSLLLVNIYLTHVIAEQMIEIHYLHEERHGGKI